MTPAQNRQHYDVVIIGAGLAGLTLARHLLRESDKRILLIDRREQIPPPRQKVGESSVQLGAYYYSKILDMEEHLLREHFMKYNLRFYWKTGADPKQFENYSQAYLRNFSNIPCYQLDRNKFEGELLRLNRQDPRFTFLSGTADLAVDVASEPHRIQFRHNGAPHAYEADWVVDASGRGKFLARRMELARPNPIRHGTAFMWAEGLVDIDKLTDLSPREIRMKRHRRHTGHLPLWLATNHFMGEGLWLWVIPLQGKTSLGLVYDNRLIPHERVWTRERLLDWICDAFPLFERDLRGRHLFDYGTIKDFSYDCVQTMSEQKWAVSGEAGRFTDPLYSPGSDLISMHNTLIVDAILTSNPAELKSKVRIYEQLMQGFYGGTVPTYAASYDCLGDQEAFVLKYVWELSVYFSFYVFPFINELFTNRRFIAGFLTRFARLGRINRTIQVFLSGYYQWKKQRERPSPEPVFYEFTDFAALRASEKLFYEIGVSVDDGLSMLNARITDLEQLARFILAHVCSRVTGDSELLFNAAFVEDLDLNALEFDADAIARMRGDHAGKSRQYQWPFSPHIMNAFQPAMEAATTAV